MRHLFVFSILSVLILSACNKHQGQEFPYPRIQDAADILRPEEEKQLDSLFALHESKYPHRLAMASTDNFEGVNIYTWSKQKLADLNLNDSGIKAVLFVINPVSREVRIEVSDALQNELPERITVQVADNAILPELKKVNYFGGLYMGAKGITSWLSVLPNNPK